MMAGSRRPQAVAYKLLVGEASVETACSEIASRLCVLDRDVEHGFKDNKASASIAVQHIAACRSHLQLAGCQALIRALFNAWTTNGRFGKASGCPFCDASNSDTLAHYAVCPVLCFYGQEIVPGLRKHGYQMSSLESFLGADALFEDTPRGAILLCAWVDAIHHTVIAFGRHQGRGTPSEFLAARLKVFAVKFGRSAFATKTLSEGLSPYSSSMTQWT